MGLMTAHVRAWRRFRQQDLEEEDYDYRRRQFRRRMQTSAMLGLLAVAIFAGNWLGKPSLWGVFFWSGVLLMVGWVTLLAIADLLATKHHFGRLRRTYLVEEAKLQAELRRIEASRRNGRSGGRAPGAKNQGAV